MRIAQKNAVEQMDAADRINETDNMLKQIAQLTKERDELKSKLHQSDLNFDALERQNKHLLTEQSHEENTRKLLQHQMEQAQQERDQLAAKVEEMRQVLGWAYGWLGCEDCSTTEQCEECKDMGAAIDHALSDQCGVGWFKKCPKCGHENH